MRTVIVTGAAEGLGAAIASTFAADGARVLLVDIAPSVMARARALPDGCWGMVYDLANESCGEVVLDEAERRLGGCDTLINNAAWSYHCPLAAMTPADFDRLIAINQRAPFLLSQAFAREIVRSDSRPTDPCIVNVSSVNAISGNTNLAAYAGTKGAIEAMTRALAVELAPRGIRVNAIRPGVIETENARSVIARREDPDAYWNDFLVKVATKPTDLANVVGWLCSPAAATITGAIWTIDGGYSAH